MAKAPTRPNAKEPDKKTVSPEAHDAPGLSPLERMTELTRRVINVPKDEIAPEKWEKRHR
jgi:hypothetical protein